MTDFLDRISNLSPKRLALLALELNEKLEDINRRRREPIAVVGLACRFPGGADDPDRFWELLRDGRDAIIEVPADRWDARAWYDPNPDAPGRMSVATGGFLQNVDQFEPGFFGISPREALTMDPQQRLLLEVTWQALELAGIAPESLAGSSTGVFVGVCNSDYFQRVLGRGVGEIDAYLASGNAHSVAAGRIAYTLGLQGPAVALDTACSSSLVALNVACQSLRSGETSMAICGGVNLMCSPETTITLSKSHMLAPDGRCKTFDASADGFARGEGCGVLLLKRLSDAQADGDRILAVVRGIATNQDGRSGGLTVPNGPAQEAVIQAALADAGVKPADVDYVEAHGTGTSLGDPIEVRALAAVYGMERDPRSPLWIGSVKTNIGHLESAAGIAGVIKVILSMEHERLPRHLHFKQPSPHIAWQDIPLQVPADAQDWRRGDRPRIAGVSSFGFSGTNAHAILEEPPPKPDPARGATTPAQCLTLSARSEHALRDRARHLADVLGAPEPPPIDDVAHTLNAGRSHLAERAAFVVDDAASAARALREFSDGRPGSLAGRGSVTPGQRLEVVFLFTGQGSQYPGMARELYDTAPEFRAVIDRCDDLLGADAHGRTLKSVLWGGTGESPAIHETAWTQPALFAVEYGLAQLWRAWGIEPAAVIGHSVGEYVAACVAGVFSFEDGLRLISERGKLMQALPPGGTMAAVFGPATAIEAAVRPYRDRVAIAAYNAADSVVVSGESTAVDALLADLARHNLQGHRLFVSLAAHSPLVEPALDAMQRCAERVPMAAPRIPVAWNVSGETSLPRGAPDAAYWRNHLRQPVRFAEGLTALLGEGFRTFLEVGPHPTLIALAQRNVTGDDVYFASSLRRGKGDWREMMTAVGQLYARGAAPNWAAISEGRSPRRIPLPTYPFERKSYWIRTDRLPSLPQGPVLAEGSDLRVSRVRCAAPVFERLLLPHSPAYLAEHRLNDAVLVAAPVMMELVQHAAVILRGKVAPAVGGFSVSSPLVLPAEGRIVQVHFEESSEAETPFRIFSSPGSESGDWTLHAVGRLSDESRSTPSSPPGSGEASATSGFREVAGKDHYERLARLGIDLRDGFRTIRRARCRDGEARVELELPAACHDTSIAWVHPVLLDGVLQSAGLALPENEGEADVYLLSEVQRIDLPAGMPSSVQCLARRLPANVERPSEWRVDVEVLDPTGRRLGGVSGAVLRRASPDALSRIAGLATATATDDGMHYGIEWREARLASSSAAGLVDPSTTMKDVARSFSRLAAEHGLSVYAPLLSELDRLSIRHVVDAMRALGFDATPGRRFSVADEMTRLGVVPAYSRLFARILEWMAQDSLLRPLGVDWEVVGLPLHDGPDDPYEAVLARFGPVDGELRTLRRCGPKLAEVLTGRQDPVQLLFPNGSFEEARTLYVESPFARVYNGALADSLTAAMQGLQRGSRLRILEIGAGTGGTTTYVLPRLPADRSEYVFTDVSPLFLERAARQFADYPFLRCSLLDVEQDLVTQGYPKGQYDVVIAANVLHATVDLRASVGRARELLAPGGLLLLLEGIRPQRWVDLTFGLTEGWWRFRDEQLRPNYPLIGRDAWKRVLEEAGLTDVRIQPQGEEADASFNQQVLIAARAPIVRQSWMISGSEGDLARALAARLRERGDSVRFLAVGEEPMSDGGNLIYLGALDLMEAAPDDPLLPVRVTELAAVEPLRLLGHLARRESAGRAWLVTRGVHAIRSAITEQSAYQGTLWGVGRGFALEHPDKWGGLVDLPLEGDERELIDAMLQAFHSGDAEDQLAYRDGQWFAPRIVPVTPGEAPQVQLRPDAAYMVTGAFGGLGPLVARWLVDRGARHLALVGRNVRGDADFDLEMERRGVSVQVFGADVADAQALARVLEAIRGSGTALRGIVHAAAHLDAAPLRGLQSRQVETMLRPKLLGTVNLERLTRTLELDFLVLFSSTTALLGASGLAHYAAANAFLDAFAAAHDAPGRRVLSVNWGTWEVMRLASADSQKEYLESGLEPLQAAEAFDALSRLLNGGSPNAIVARVNWAKLKPLHEARRPRPLLAELGGSNRSRADAAETDAAAPGLQLSNVPASERQDVIRGFVAEAVASVLGRDPTEPIPPAVGLFELGMDSLMSIELRRRLERGAGRALPSTLTFNYPNVEALTRYLEAELNSQVDDSAANASLESAPQPSSDDLGELTDDELEARLLSRLSEVK